MTKNMKEMRETGQESTRTRVFPKDGTAVKGPESRASSMGWKGEEASVAGSDNQGKAGRRQDGLEGRETPQALGGRPHKCGFYREGKQITAWIARMCDMM